MTVSMCFVMEKLWDSFTPKAVMSVASWREGGQGYNCPPSKWAVGKLSKMLFLLEFFYVKNAKFRAENFNLVEM